MMIENFLYVIMGFLLPIPLWNQYGNSLRAELKNNNEKKKRIKPCILKKQKPFCSHLD
jgi:hypothetical protein